MTLRRPLVVVSGVTSELPVGDSVLGANAGTLVAGSGLDGGGALVGGSVVVNASIAPAASGLIFAGDALAIDGAAQVTADAALASGSAALTDLTSKVSKAGDVVSGTFVVDSQSYGVVSSTVSSGVILLDFSASNNFDITLEGNSTLAPSVSPSGGQSGAVYIRQDGTGGRTLAYSGGWSFSNGSAPTLTTTASGTDLLAYYAASSTTIVANLIAAVSGV